MATIIAIPGARRYASPLFYFFGIFDDLFLYQFHDRIFGLTMTAVFENINTIEYKKWSLVNYTTIIDLFGYNITDFDSTIDYQT